MIFSPLDQFILCRGQQFAQQLSDNNPELIEQLRNQMPQADGDKRSDDEPSSQATG